MGAEHQMCIRDRKKADSYEIEGILYKLGGWKKYDGNVNGDVYKRQIMLQVSCIQATAEG